MVAGTAAAVGVALRNDRRLVPALAEPSPAPPPAFAGPAIGVFPNARSFVARRFALATLFGIAVLAFAATLPMLTAIATNLGASDPLAARQGPPAGLRAASGVSGGIEQSYSLAVPAADDIGAAIIAATFEQRRTAEVSALQQIWAENQALAAAAPPKPAPAAPVFATSAPATAFRGGPPQSLGAASGLAAGAILTARITVYGCTGPGGGFCGNMATGIRVFEGAAACSYDLPFGTKLRIIGDPTGRIYECLDRGAIRTTWVDVFFNNTSEGIAWASLLGGTSAQIEIIN